MPVIRHFATAIFSGLATCALAGCATGGKNLESLVDALMRDYSGNVPGASVLVLRDGAPLVRRSYGMADLEAGSPASLQTNYRLASVSKQFTAAADVRYGYGWRITGETLWHSGETVGFRNVIVRYPRRHLTVVVLTNRDDPEPYAMAKRIAEAALHQ